MAVGKLERLELREVWKHEAYDFTRWLENNIDVLNSALGLNIVNVDREQSAGSFSIDLVAQDDTGSTIIIENQLEKSNHDHLGKLITYLTALKAKAAIWIVSDPRPEHISAISWLNESNSADFYMVKMEAVKIGTSDPAPLFTLIVGPSEEAKEVGQVKREMAARYHIRKNWWISLIQRSARINKLHTHITPGMYAWIGTSAGLRGLNLNYVVWEDECAAELYIDRGKNSDEENSKILDQLLVHRKEIESSYGNKLDWERLEEKRACRVRCVSKAGGYRSSEENWPEIQDEIILMMDKLEKALRPFIKQLKIN